MLTAMNPLSKRRREHTLSRIKALIGRLTDSQLLKGRAAQMAETDISNMCILLNEVLLEEPSCLSLNLDAKLFVVGDTHGHYTHLLQAMNELGHPPSANYLFLGNYVNRGDKSMETIVLLFAYKLLYPKSFHLLRGNHECDQLGRMYGFYAECTKRFSVHLWNIIIDTFNYLPFAALIENTFFCSHSGISPSLLYTGCTDPRSLQEYLSVWIPRPTATETNLLATHLMWSAPSVGVEKWEANPAGLGYLFGPSIVDEFCGRFRILQLVRSNEMLPEGYEFFAQNKLITIFSVPDYLGIYKNSGAIIQLVRSEESKVILGQIRRFSPTVSEKQIYRIHNTALRRYQTDKPSRFKSLRGIQSRGLSIWQ